MQVQYFHSDSVGSRVRRLAANMCIGIIIIINVIVGDSPCHNMSYGQNRTQHAAVTKFDSLEIIM